MLTLYLSLLENEDARARFARLFQAHERTLYRIALTRLQNPALAEEAAQQAWLHVAAAFHKIETKFANQWDAIGGYLVIVVKNVCRDVAAQERRTAPLPEDWDAPDPQTRGESVERRIVELIRAMPPAYREILELKFVLEYSNREIAKRLDLNVSTVATRIDRGRKQLVQVLREEGIEP